MSDDGRALALGAVGALAAGLWLVQRERRARTPVEVGIHFPGLDGQQLGHLFKAQQQLRAAGVGFDTGYDMAAKTRDWEFDWSLSGPANVTFRRFRR